MQLPILFIGHGSPMNAIETNEYTNSWKELGKSLKTLPRAILMISAHWITEGKTLINTTEQPEMIYDMYGFPPSLYETRYSPPGSREIAEEILHTLAPEYALVWEGNHGIDHGAWSVLIHLFPEANIPVIQMSLDYSKSPEWHYHFGKKLQILREQGILLIGSGNIVHNLREIDWSESEQYSWAREFDKKIALLIERKKHDEICNFQNWGNISRQAHPTYEHLLPLFPLLGATVSGDVVEFSTEKITMGSLSMRSIVWR